MIKTKELNLKAERPRTGSNLLRATLYSVPIVLALAGVSEAYIDNYVRLNIDTVRQMLDSNPNAEEKRNMPLYANCLYNEIKDGYSSGQLKRSTFENAFPLFRSLAEAGYLPREKLDEIRGFDKSAMRADDYMPDRTSSGFTLENLVGRENAQDFRNMANGFDQAFFKFLPQSVPNIVAFLNSAGTSGLKGLEDKLNLLVSSDYLSESVNINWSDIAEVLKNYIPKENLTSVVNSPQKNRLTANDIRGQHLGDYALREGLIYPLKGDVIIDSGFGYRINPINPLNGVQFHRGVDMTPVDRNNNTILAIESGFVIKMDYDDNSGNYIIIQNGNKRDTYCHLKSYLPDAKEGRFVKQGTPIAIMGGTGKVTGRHLHIMHTVNGTPVNIISYRRR